MASQSAQDSDFPAFQRLPNELRSMVWKEFFRQPRVHVFRWRTKPRHGWPANDGRRRYNDRRGIYEYSSFLLSGRESGGELFELEHFICHEAKNAATRERESFELPAAGPPTRTTDAGYSSETERAYFDLCAFSGFKTRPGAPVVTEMPYRTTVNWQNDIFVIETERPTFSTQCPRSPRTSYCQLLDEAAWMAKVHHLVITGEAEHEVRHIDPSYIDNCANRSLRSARTLRFCCILEEYRPIQKLLNPGRIAQTPNLKTWELVEDMQRSLQEWDDSFRRAGHSDVLVKMEWAEFLQRGEEVDKIDTVSFPNV